MSLRWLALAALLLLPSPAAAWSPDSLDATVRSVMTDTGAKGLAVAVIEGGQVRAVKSCETGVPWAW
ncbi:hypothetical protein [Phenylobacterium sp. J367]|uniref:hypothetical protein n=1 Tax=Phenylobacterium sp. J367 TaxID=2898435 RepID=UPI0021508E52|nr:hypothetical protein [Phenylobacterium sp. J367]MCR5879187.1 hypothetical protein [Phenylobacterium sp. J367]